MGTNSVRRSLVNAALYLGTCALIGTGLLLELRMDEEDGSVRLLGMGRDDWGEIHILVAITFIALTTLHLLLHGAWIKAAVAKARWALPLLIAGLGLIAALQLLPTDDMLAGGGTKAGHHHEDDD